jgi:hypothetical protein
MTINEQTTRWSYYNAAVVNVDGEQRTTQSIAVPNIVRGFLP